MEIKSFQRNAEINPEEKDKQKKLISEINSIIDKYFPKIRKRRNQKEIDSSTKHQLSQVMDSAKPTTKWEDYEKIKNTKEFFAATVIRYVDDFIDEDLWPKIDTFEPSEFEKRYTSLLHNALTLAKKMDSDFPDELIELPILEMKFEVFKDQKFFDENIERYVQRKSLDIAYISQKKNKVNKSQRFDLIEPKKYMQEALDDVACDFIDNERGETDFDLRKFIEKNNISPDALIEVIKKYIPEIFISFDEWKKDRNNWLRKYEEIKEKEKYSKERNIAKMLDTLYQEK